MTCFHPLRAWRKPNGEIIISKQEQADCLHLRLPCGGCLGCRMASAQAWALRCQLELQQHKSAVFTTLTYDEENVPNTLQQRHVQLWLKRLRKAATHVPRIRYFYTGEYGEQTQRPHYHAILYGLSMRDMPLIEQKWTYGHTRTEPITPRRIAYTAGYCQKKINYKRYSHERVDPLTGEVYQWQPAFRQMSTNPGIGDKARQFTQSWRLYAIKDGHKMAVPRYLHEAWKQQATAQEKETLAYEKYLLTLTRDNVNIEAAELIAIKQQQQQGEKRLL